MANALMIGCSKIGMDFAIGAPKILFPSKEIVDTCEKFAKESGNKIQITENPLEAVKDADIIYTDVWVSMGEEAKSAERLAILRPYQVNDEIMSATGKETTIFLHCLPAVRGNEVTNDVIEGEKSLVFDEAENRMHTIKAVMVATAGN